MSVLVLVALLVAGMPAVHSVEAAPASDSIGSPTLAAIPAAGRPLTPILLTGHGYPPGATVDFTFNEIPGAPPQVLAGEIAGPDGSLPPLQLTIPAGAAQGGVGLISALWTTAPTTPIQATGAVGIPFAVTPADRGLSVTPGMASAGTTAVVSGTGFEPNTPVQVQLTDASGAAVAVVSGAAGTSTGALLTIGVAIPLTATTGLGVINATDTAGNVAGAPIVILPPAATSQSIPSFTLNPTRAVAGEVVRFTAGGLPPNAPVSLALSDAAGSQATQSSGTLSTTDGTGQVQGAFIVPSAQAMIGGAGTAGFSPANGFTLGGNGGTLLGITLRAQPSGSLNGVMVSAPLVIAGTRLAIFPPTGTPGQTYTLIGTGFGADEQVTVAQTDAAGVITQLGTAQTSADGVFSLFGTYPTLPAGAPATAAGAFTITATGEPSGLVASAVLAVHAAPSIALTPYVVPPGQPVVVSGAAFPANSAVTIRIDSPGFGPGQAGLLSAATDDGGAFTLPFTVPIAAPLGPLAIQVSAAGGTTVSGVLTVDDQSASVRASPLAVKPGQSLTVQGQGFASGETLDLFLAQGVAPTYVAAQSGGFDRQAPPQPGQPEPLPGTLRTITADALGSFAVSYSLNLSGVRLPNAAYLLGIRGETSGRLAVTAFGIAGAASSPIGPSPPAAVCKGQIGTAVSVAGGLVQYLVTPLAATVTGKETRTTIRSQLLLVNTGDQAATITVAYLLDTAGTKAKSPLLPASAGARIRVHTVTFGVAAHTVATRQVRADSGAGTVVGIIARAQPATQALDANGCPVSPLTTLPAADTPQIRTVLITNRTRTSLKGHSAPKVDAIVTNAINQGSTGSAVGGPATHWYFAGGGAGGAYAEDLSLFNPQQDSAHVQVRALAAKGLVGAVQTMTIAPFGQGIVRVRPPSCARGKSGCTGELGVAVQSTTPVVAARGLAWGIPRAEQSANPRWLVGVGIDLSPGTSQPARQQFIPYASTANGDHAELAILNPAGCPKPTAKAKAKKGRVTKTPAVSACAAVVTISAYTAFGAKVATARVTVAGNTRLVVPLARTHGGIGVGTGVYALAVQSTLPVAAELAQYVGGGPGNSSGVGAHAGFEQLGVAGATALSGAGFASRTGLLVHLFNPTSGLMVMRVQGMGSAGAYFAQSYQVGAGASLTLTVPAPPGGGTEAAGVAVTCSGPCAGTILMGGARASGTPARWGAVLQ